MRCVGLWRYPYVHFTLQCCRRNFTNASGSLSKLQKVMRDAGFGSRRYCESLISEGKVTINNRVATLGACVSRCDNIYVNGKAVSKHSASAGKEKVYIVMNKPRETLSTRVDDFGRKTIMDLLDDSVPADVVPIGRLDYDTTGLLLLTNDGDMNNMIAHPTLQVQKKYMVEIFEDNGNNGNARRSQGTHTMSPDTMNSVIERLQQGVVLHDHESHNTVQNSRPVRISAAKPVGDRSLLISIGEGRKRVVKRVMKALGFDVSSLDRVAVGSLELSKMGLSRGECRALTKSELVCLQQYLAEKQRHHNIKVDDT